MTADSQRARILPIDPWRPEWSKIRLAAAATRRGEVIAMPTDTVYGLAGNPFQPGVTERIFRIKRRAETQPILLLIASMRQLPELVSDPPDVFRAIAAEFWPGPLTVVLPAANRVPAAITAGTGTVAVRWPSAHIAQALIRAAGSPLTGTSANISGRPAATTAAQVKRQFGGRVYYIVDGGPARVCRPSTLIDLTGNPRILREGAVSAARLAKYLR